MILSGSNNCTEFIQGREVLERNWYPMTLSNKDKRIAIPAEELLERARAISTGDGADYEFAKQGGKWLYCKDVLKWVEIGIRTHQLFPPQYAFVRQNRCMAWGQARNSPQLLL